MSLDPKTSIVVPEDRYGLYAIDVLDPDLVHICLLTLFFFFKLIYWPFTLKNSCCFAC